MRAGDLVDVDVEETGAHRADLAESGLLQNLSLGSEKHIGITGFNVAAGLQPATELSMKDQEQRVALWRENESTRCEVAGDKVVPREALRASLKQLQHGFFEGRLLGVCWLVGVQE